MQQQRALLHSYCRPCIHQKSSRVLNASSGDPDVRCNTGVTYEMGNVVLSLLSCWFHIHHSVALNTADSFEGGRLG